MTAFKLELIQKRLDWLRSEFNRCKAERAALPWWRLYKRVKLNDQLKLYSIYLIHTATELATTRRAIDDAERTRPD